MTQSTPLPAKELWILHKRYVMGTLQDTPVSYSTIRYRRSNLKWSDEKIINTPSHNSKKNSCRKKTEKVIKMIDNGQAKLKGKLNPASQKSIDQAAKRMNDDKIKKVSASVKEDKNILTVRVITEHTENFHRKPSWTDIATVLVGIGLLIAWGVLLYLNVWG